MKEEILKMEAIAAGTSNHLLFGSIFFPEKLQALQVCIILAKKFSHKF